MIDADDALLPDPYARRLAERAAALLPLGTLEADVVLDDPAAAAALAELADRLRDTYPYNSPRYAGQMLKPPVPVAWAAYATAMLLNPNNHALDGGPATAAMEKEVVDLLGAMLHVGAPRLGHLTLSGTIANLEALFVARERHGREAVVVSSEAAHYTHARMCGVLGVPHETIAQDARGRMDADALRARLERGGVGTVVATLGTTALGALDPLPEIADLCAEHGARLHVDTAYGGFFALLADDDDHAPTVDSKAYNSLARADSVVVDPHKHGLQPYGCGCVLFADPSVGRFYAHDSPYTYFTSGELHLGEISLECSRAGAAAAALWTTLRALPPTRDGLGAHLAAARGAGLTLAQRLQEDPRVAVLVEPELDIVCVLARDAEDPSAAADRAFAALARDGWHVATLRADRAWATRSHPWLAERGGDPAGTVTALRCCLLKREHAGIVDALALALGDALAA